MYTWHHHRRPNIQQSHPMISWTVRALHRVKRRATPRPEPPTDSGIEMAVFGEWHGIRGVMACSNFINHLQSLAAGCLLFLVILRYLDRKQKLGCMPRRMPHHRSASANPSCLSGAARAREPKRPSAVLCTSRVPILLRN
ncbi:hypothetical protein QBC43DRAFT_334967 [Cladorrhinum sp. PSN259]|nr:hypothetical protein QBC43DRAFT_334967 [Cladorrhinum sp. PSN259]